MGPVAASADAGDVAELVGRFLLGEFFRGKGLTGLGGIDVEADGTLVERLDDVVAIGIKDVHQAPVVDHATVTVDFDDHVADSVDALAVGTAVVGGAHAQEAVAVLGVVKGVRVVGVARRETTIEDLAADEVVLGVVLAVAPGERTVLGLLEAHEVAGLPRVFRVADFLVEEPPADFARGVDDADVGVEGPFHGTARRVVPGEAGAERNRALQLAVDEIETVLEFLVNLLHLDVEGTRLVGHAGRERVDAGGVEAVGVGELFALALMGAGVAHLDRVLPVGIETEDGHARVRLELGAGDLVLDLLALGLRDDADRDVGEFVAAVADDGGERSHLVGIDDDFADVALDGIADVGARGAAGGERRGADDENGE